MGLLMEVFRDAAMLQTGAAEESLINVEQTELCDEIGEKRGLRGSLNAVKEIDGASSLISRNVTPKLVIDNLLAELTADNG
jgi:hypothetical protein